jgi:hypothetical protein
MIPSVHYRAVKYIVLGAWVVGLLYWWHWCDTRNVTPVILLLLGTFALAYRASKIPARCSGCGERRMYVFRDRLSNNMNSIKYKCAECGHIEDTGILESFSEQ